MNSFLSMLIFFLFAFSRSAFVQDWFPQTSRSRCYFSMYSSSFKNSRDSSKVKIWGVLITTVWSFGSWNEQVGHLFGFRNVYGQSFSQKFPPMIIPSYTSVPGLTKIVPRSSMEHDKSGCFSVIDWDKERTTVTSTDFSWNHWQVVKGVKFMIPVTYWQELSGE